MEIHNQIFYTTLCSCVLSLTGGSQTVKFHSELYICLIYTDCDFIFFRNENFLGLYVSIFILSVFVSFSASCLDLTSDIFV